MTTLREIITNTLDNTQVDELVTKQSVEYLVDELVMNLVLAGVPRNWMSLSDVEEFRARIEDIANQVTLNENFQVIISRDEEIENGRFFYQIKCWRKDVITGIEDWGYGGKAYLSRHASNNELVQTIFGLYKGYWEHEARESFQWNERRVFGPHIATEALWDVARRVDVRSAKHEEDTPTTEESEEQQLAALRAKLSRPTRSPFALRDKVSWKDAQINTEIVYGHVVGFDVDRQEVQVTWADGSGPTWHRMESLQKLSNGR